MQINPPTNCPSCHSDLSFSGDILYCRNPECGSINQKRVEHFAKTMKIKGLGPAAIEKLGLSSILDVYSITLDEATHLLSSEKTAVKLLNEIEQSTAKKLNDVLPALGIPLIGNSATVKLAAVCSDIHDITEETCKAAGLGPKATTNLLDWLSDNNWYLFLPQNLIFDNTTSQSVSSKEVICISGKLTSFKTKSEAASELEKLGYTVKSSITKDVQILVNESGVESDKTKKARESGIRIVTNLRTFIMENN